MGTYITFTIPVNYGAKTEDHDLAMQVVQRTKAYGIQLDSYFAAHLIQLYRTLSYCTGYLVYAAPRYALCANPSLPNKLAGRPLFRPGTIDSQTQALGCECAVEELTSSERVEEPADN